MFYDTIEYCESTNTKGLLIIILIILDFSKAFDTIEWAFIEDLLKLFNFGDNFSNMIHLFQHNSTSRVEQNGHLSEQITLARGCRQGDPLSPYVFVLCAEILSQVLREFGGIKGIEVHGVQFKSTQYVDDTTLMVSDLESVRNIIKVLRWFKTVSGLIRLIMKKTKSLKLGHQEAAAFLGRPNSVLQGQLLLIFSEFIMTLQKWGKSQT